MTTPFKIVPDRDVLARTWTNPQKKAVFFLRQKPEGFIVCHHCLKETKLDASGILPALQNHNKTARNTWRMVATTCHLCSGPFVILPSTEEPGLLCSKPSTPKPTDLAADP